MPVASAQNYWEPEQLEAAYASAKVELTPTAPGPFSARVVKLELDQLWMQRVSETTPRIKWAAQSPKRCFIRFQTEPGAPLITDGIPLQPNELFYHSRAHSYYEKSTGPIHWAAISMPAEDFATAATAMAGRDLGPPREPMRVVSSVAAMKKLRQLHAEAGALAEQAPRLATAKGTAHGLEQLLIAALVGCLSSREEQIATWSQRYHETVMRRFHRALTAEPERAFYVPEICAAINVPERTLRLCCHERLGMGPKEYLLRRRMQLARRDLRAATPSQTTVTEVATRFGFWHFGRFASSYRQLFGESPSVTLNHLPT